MTELQVTVPDSAHSFIHEQVAAGRYQSASELVTELLEEARIRQAKVGLAKQLQEGLDSGPAVPITKEFLKQQRVELLSRLPPGSLE